MANASTAQAALAPLHIYITDGHEGAGWNVHGTTHRITAMRHGEDDTVADFYSLQSACVAAYNVRAMAWREGRDVVVHDLTGRG